nr:MAG TPA: hypothetical protein [Caudoviricetes sp.]
MTQPYRLAASCGLSATGDRKTLGLELQECR